MTVYCQRVPRDPPQDRTTGAALEPLKGHLVKLGSVGHVQVGGGHVAHVQQRGGLGAPAVGALHRQLVQAGRGARQLPRAAMQAWDSTEGQTQCVP